ncbi:MAG: YcaO-like family protein [Microbacterium sp.]
MDELIQEEDACALIAIFDRCHDLSMAFTNRYAPQNWSVVCPVASCPDCAEVPVVMPSLRSTVVPEGGDVDRDPTAGARRTSAENFVRANRWAIGFASIVGNPVAVEDAAEVSLVNAPIRTSTQPEDCEVSGGKGLSLSQALASFLGEAFERWMLAASRRISGVVGSFNMLPNAIDVTREFGFPARDEDPSIDTYDPGILLEWLPAEELTSGSEVDFPSNLVFCPYLPAATAHAISFGSTNGASAGGSVVDATEQALLELVEWDAFWFYARTGHPASKVAFPDLPADVAAMMAQIDGQFYVHLLPNPFSVAVASVTVHAGSTFHARSARGTGASGNATDAIRRAFVECIQMLYSLNTGVGVEDVSSDMRGLWYTGRAFDVFHNLFDLPAHDDPSWVPLEVQGSLATHILESARAQLMRVFRVVILDDSERAVVKCAMTGVSVSDSTYFRSGVRLETFASEMNLRTIRRHDIQYSGSLFM